MPGLLQRPSSFNFGGVPSRTIQGTPKQSPIASQYKTYNEAVKGDKSLYDELLQGYKGLLDTAGSAGKTTFQPEEYTPQSYNYTPSKDFTGAIAKYKDLSETGGYTKDDLYSLRERGVSPIRSVYAGALRDINRRASITGSSASFGALRAKMAREQSAQMADALNDVNAGIAERVASGRREGTAGYANVAGQENAIRNQYGSKNVDAQNEASKFNVGSKNQAKQFNLTYGADQQARILDALKSLYAASPGRSALYGGQATSSANLQNNITQGNRQSGLDWLGRMLSGSN